MARAVLHVSTDPLPVAIGLDTSFIVQVLDGRDPQNAEALAIYRRLVGGGVVGAVCRPVLRLEFWSAWTRAVRGLTHPDVRRLAREARETMRGQRELALAAGTPGSSESERHVRLAEGEQLLDLLLSYLPVTSVRLTDGLPLTARAQIVRWGLKPLDAVILAVADTVAEAVGGPAHLATMDADFTRVAGLHFWGVGQ